MSVRVLGLKILGAQRAGFAVNHPAKGVVGVYRQVAGKWRLLGYFRGRRSHTELFDAEWRPLGTIKRGADPYAELLRVQQALAAVAEHATPPPRPNPPRRARARARAPRLGYRAKFANGKTLLFTAATDARALAFAKGLGAFKAGAKPVSVKRAVLKKKSRT